MQRMRIAGIGRVGPCLMLAAGVALNGCVAGLPKAKKSATVVTIKGMAIEKVFVSGKVTTLKTTGGSFRFNFDKGIIEISQRIGTKRQLASITLDRNYTNALVNHNSNGFDYTWSGTKPEDPQIIISGDSVIRFYNIKRLKVALCFTPVHQKFIDVPARFNAGGLLALDETGGLAITPSGYAFSKSPLPRFENGEWKLDAANPQLLLFIAVLPPREFDWERSFWPVVHYSSHIDRYPSDEQIVGYSKYAKVLEMHSWVWQNRYDENERDENGNKWPAWHDNSYFRQDYKWIPDNEAELKRVIKIAHAYGMKVAPYVGFSEGDYDLGLAEIRRLKDTYGIDGVYVDGLFGEKPEWGYPAARYLRELFGEEGWLTVHNSHGSGCWAPFINSYADLIITSEHELLDRWTSTSYNISNATASFWPEAPLRGSALPLKTLIDDSLLYNNRVIFMTGEQGQWRFWRLYFTPEEMQFMKEYYLPLLRRMKNIGYRKFVKQAKRPSVEPIPSWWTP